MTKEKLTTDSVVLHKFMQIFCDKKHNEVGKKEGVLLVEFDGEKCCDIKYELCEECEKLFLYACHKLEKCPHEVKPSCRKCPDNCYEKPAYKQMAKVMSFSGMYLGLTKIKKLFFK